MKQSKYTRSARGKPCSLRLPGCQPGPDNNQVVLCHLNLYGGAGMGQRAIDIHAVYGCHNCHQIIDGPNRLDYQGDMLRALLETQRTMVSEELIKL